MACRFLRAGARASRLPVRAVTKPSKAAAKANRAAKLARALRANMARRKQSAPPETGEAAGPEAETYRRRDADLAPLAGKARRRE
jgi:hypothetical protein